MGTFRQKAERIGRMVPPLMTKAVAEAVFERVLRPAREAENESPETAEKAI